MCSHRFLLFSLLLSACSDTPIAHDAGAATPDSDIADSAPGDAAERDAVVDTFRPIDAAGDAPWDAPSFDGAACVSESVPLDAFDCPFALPAPPSGETIDLGLVNVDLRFSVCGADNPLPCGPDGEPILIRGYQVPSGDRCPDSPDSPADRWHWYYVEDTMGGTPRIQPCEFNCMAIAEAHIVYGCITLH